MSTIQVTPSYQEVKPQGYYVYTHVDYLGNTFYVGKGKNKRGWNKSNRSNSWIERASVRFSVCICQDLLDEKSAYLLEMWLISKFRHNGINIGNSRSGGNGSIGTFSPLLKNVSCSNGMKFNGLVDAVYWVIKNINPKADGSAISRSCMGLRKKAYGLNWWYSDYNDSPIDPLPNVNKYKYKQSAKKSLPVICGNGMFFFSVNNAVKWFRKNIDVRCNPCKIREVCNGGRLTHLGQTWKYFGSRA